MQKIQALPKFKKIKLPSLGTSIKVFKEEIFDVIFSIITSFSMIFSGFIPFCLSFYVTGETNKTCIFKFLAIAISSIFAVGGALSIKYIVPMLLYSAITLIIPLKKPIFKASIISGLLFAAGLIATYFDGFLLYDVVVCIVEAFVCFVGVFIMEKALPLIKNFSDRTTVSQDEFVCLTAVLAISIFAFAKIPTFFSINICNILCIVIILMLCLKGELGMGATVGVIVGVANGMNNFNLSATVGAFAFSSLVAGLFKNYGKLGVCLGFVLANTIITIFLNSSSEVLISIYEILIAIAIFFIIPKQIMNKICFFSGKVNDNNVNSKEISAQFKNIVKTKIFSAASSIDRLSKMYINNQEVSKDLDKRDLISFFDTASKKVCSDCQGRFNCWQHNYQATYSHMLKMFSLANLNGKILTKQLPDDFKNNCTKQDEFVDSFNNMYEMFNLSKYWKNKIVESKNAAASQLKDVSQIMKKVIYETDIGIDTEVENDIKVALDKRNIRVKYIWAVVSDQKSDKFEITICSGADINENSLMEAVCEVLGREVRVGKIKSDHGDILVKFYPKHKYSIEVNASFIAKHNEEICGDSFISMPLSNGGHMFALSDGMGSGKEAANASKTTIELLKRFFEAGFETDEALNLINSTLLLKTNSDTFATLDLCAIDLNDATAKFIKIGGVNSYIKNDLNVEKVEFSSLPIGILMNVEKKICVKNLKSDNMIIMLTDGICDVMSNDTELKNIIKNTNTNNPGVLSDLILKEALKKCNNQPKDDMTVLVARIY